MMADELKKEDASKKMAWLKRGGIALFAFFLIKGLVWIGIAIAVWLGVSKATQ